MRTELILLMLLTDSGELGKVQSVSTEVRLGEAKTARSVPEGAPFRRSARHASCHWTRTEALAQFQT